MDWTYNHQQFLLKSEANQIAKYMTFYFLSDKNMKEKYKIIKFLQWNNALSIIEDYLELFFLLYVVTWLIVITLV